MRDQYKNNYSDFVDNNCNVEYVLRQIKIIKIKSQMMALSHMKIR